MFCTLLVESLSIGLRNNESRLNAFQVQHHYYKVFQKLSVLNDAIRDLVLVL